MKVFATLLLLLLTVTQSNSQLLKKLKQKAEQTIGGKPSDNPEENKPTGDAGKKEKTASTESDNTDNANKPVAAPNMTVYNKFDFIPGNTVLYYDNFEKDNAGESPAGWITSTSAEVVTIDGLDGNWLKLAATSAKHITRSKKQSWGNNFTVEFDLLIVKDTYDPRINFSLMNTAGNLVTDEKILQTGRHEVYVGAILGDGGKKTRVYLSKGNNINSTVSDQMSESLLYSNTIPVHISMCVQGKRFRFWWNEKKIYDMQVVNEQYMPNQLCFDFGSVGGSNFYVSNIRIAKDIPDTRAKYEEGKLVSNLLFHTNTAKLKPESMGPLLEVSKVLKEVTSPVKIVGHTDSDGEDAANQQLSVQRAEEVKNILVSQYGIDESKLTTEGRGESQPLADNNSQEGKAQNRRVEFIFKAEADKYVKPAGITTTTSKPAGNATKPVEAVADAPATVKLQSKILTTTLPYAQFMKTADNKYTFIASKEEGNSKENYFKIQLESVNTSLKAETFNFKEINQKNPLYGTKKYSEITNTEAVLYYGTVQKPFIYKFSPIIATGTMASYVSASLERNLPAASTNSKFVIEKVADGKASGYFTLGIMIQGLKPVTKGDAMQETFTTGFQGELKCTFSNVPVY